MDRLYLTERSSFPYQYFEGAVARVLDLQNNDGAIPWSEEGVIDPWNHIEAAMGLSITGYQGSAERAYRYLADTQLADGSWWCEYGNAVPLDDATRKYDPQTAHTGPHLRDTNFCAYIATGVWHHYLVTQDKRFLERLWKVVDGAMGFVLAHQSDHGEIRWAAAAPGAEEDDALLSGCASIYKSLECALSIAGEMNEPRPGWALARNRLGDAIRSKPHRFDRSWESKARFSMDWYYPVLSGAVSGEAARAHLANRWDTFVTPDKGCRCVLDQPWVTPAETAELTLALLATGQPAKAAEIFSWLHQWRAEDGAYWMGFQTDLHMAWPEEKPAWTSGAVLLAADALTNTTGAAQLFTTVSVPETAPKTSQEAQRFYHR